VINMSVKSRKSIDPVELKMKNLHCPSEPNQFDAAKICSDCETIFYQTFTCPYCANTQFMYMSIVINPSIKTHPFIRPRKFIETQLLLR
jgi:hypothetical protein